jgi:hypothetical protein
LRRPRCALRHRVTGYPCRYRQVFERVLLREFPGYKLESVSNRADLEHSCSPVYTRGVLRQGQSAFAVLGVSAEETQPSIDAASASSGWTASASNLPGAPTSRG